MLVNRLLSLLCGFVGLTALAGGLEMLIWPVQSPWPEGPTAAMLQKTPFSTLAFPGLILLVCVGLPHCVAAVFAWKRWPRFEAVSFASGLLVTGWIGIEVALLGPPVAGLQMAYFLMGLSTMTGAFLGLWIRRS